METAKIPVDEKTEERGDKAELWCGHNQRDCVVYISQLTVCGVIIISGIVNISINPEGKMTNVWLALLSSAMGYLLPAPSMKK